MATNVNIDIREKFEAAVRVVQSLPKNGSFQPSYTMTLMFYGLYKQANLGHCSISKPSFWDVTGRTKWEAWNRLGMMKREDAMLQYVVELTKIIDTMPQTDSVLTFLEKTALYCGYIDDDFTSDQPPHATFRMSASRSREEGLNSFKRGCVGQERNGLTPINDALRHRVGSVDSFDCSPDSDGSPRSSSSSSERDEIDLGIQGAASGESSEGDDGKNEKEEEVEEDFCETIEGQVNHSPQVRPSSVPLLYDITMLLPPPGVDPLLPRESSIIVITPPDTGGARNAPITGWRTAPFEGDRDSLCSPGDKFDGFVEGGMIRKQTKQILELPRGVKPRVDLEMILDTLEDSGSCLPLPEVSGIPPQCHRSVMEGSLYDQDLVEDSLYHQDLVEDPLRQQDLVDDPLYYQDQVKYPLCHQDLVDDPLYHQDLVEDRDSPLDHQSTEGTLRVACGEDTVMDCVLVRLAWLQRDMDGVLRRLEVLEKQSLTGQQGALTSHSSQSQSVAGDWWRPRGQFSGLVVTLFVLWPFIARFILRFLLSHRRRYREKSRTAS